MCKYAVIEMRTRTCAFAMRVEETEDPETYGLVCWYLANRGTERYQAGDVINLGVWETDRVERKFRLTDQSIGMKDLRGIHGRYYPEPKEGVGDFLTEDRLATVYDQLNKTIHAENPLGTTVDLRHYMESVPKWLVWITGLLTEHKVFLYHHPNVSYWARMFAGPDGDVLCSDLSINPPSS